MGVEGREDEPEEIEGEKDREEGRREESRRLSSRRNGGTRCTKKSSRWGIEGKVVGENEGFLKSFLTLAPFQINSNSRFQLVRKNIFRAGNGRKNSLRI
jgi:hypothetical protein